MRLQTRPPTIAKPLLSTLSCSLAPGATRGLTHSRHWRSKNLESTCYRGPEMSQSTRLPVCCSSTPRGTESAAPSLARRDDATLPHGGGVRERREESVG